MTTTSRPTASTITDTQLDQLYDELAALHAVARGYCPACGRGDAAPTVEDWEQQRQRADSAESRLRHLQTGSKAAGTLLTCTTDERDHLQAALARVRDLHKRWKQEGPPPIGTSMRHWWGARLAGLELALDEAAPGPDNPT